jgi:hypothetical protein
MPLLPNWTGWKSLKLVLTAVGVGAAALATSDALPPASRAIAQVVGAIDASLLAIVITLSGTAAGPTVVKGDK